MSSGRLPGPLLAFYILTAACGETRDPSPRAARPGDNAPPAGTSPMDRPHVVFTERSLVIDRLGVPVTPPVSTSSRPSPSTLESEDPSTITISPSGGLVALRAGRTRVRTLHGENSTLEVEVAVPTRIRVEPERHRVRPGGSVSLKLVDAETGETLPASAATWRSESPELVVVRGGVAYASDRIGTVRLTAEFAGAEALAEVEVASAAGLRVVPQQARLRRGDVALFRAFLASEEARGTWATSNARVLASVGGGFFQAKATGRTTACVVAAGERFCAPVEVTP